MKINSVIREINLETQGKKFYVKIFEISENAPNIIFIMTPIVSVGDQMTENFLRGLTGKSCNVFALDFPGIGKSRGKASEISLENMRKSTQVLINYIQKNYSTNIHFYGGTGTGGVIGQALVSYPEMKNNIKSFIQFGVCIFGDTTIMGSRRLFKSLYPLIRIINLLFPGGRIKFKIPEYEGFNADKENKWYKDMMIKNPGAFDFKISLLKTLMDILLSKDSPITNSISCPVLVLASEHDRYYYKEYIEKYIDSLREPKAVYWINDSHIAFDWKAEELNTKVLDWIQA